LGDTVNFCIVLPLCFVVDVDGAAASVV